MLIEERKQGSRCLH